jgi:flagellar biosynthetic protein FliQ
MSPTEIVKIGNDMLMMSILLGGPIIIAGMIIGLLISIVQTITQIQEQSIAFVFKIAASVAVFFVTAPWMLRKISDFMTYCLSHLDKFIK